MGPANSGVQTASQILKCTTDTLIGPIPDQNLKIYDAEDSSQWPDSILQKMEHKRKTFKEIEQVG